MPISGESANTSSSPYASQSAISSPITTIEVVGVTFDSALRGDGARELSVGWACCCCSCRRGGGPKLSSSRGCELNGSKKFRKKPPDCGRERLLLYWYC